LLDLHDAGFAIVMALLVVMIVLVMMMVILMVMAVPMIVIMYVRVMVVMVALRLPSVAGLDARLVFSASANPAHQSTSSSLIRSSSLPPVTTPSSAPR
jgi:hypothetical protein